MKKLLLSAAVVIGLFCSMGAFITQHQAVATAALSELKLKMLPAEEGLVGGPTTYEVTDETIEYLESLKEDGKKIVVESSGKVTIK